MQTKYKRLVATLFDLGSYACFFNSVNSVNQMASPVISKPVLFGEDATLLGFQTLETVVDLNGNFENKNKLSKIWHSVKTNYPMGFLSGLIAATAFWSYMINPQLTPELNSDISLLIGVNLQYLKNKILYRD